MRQPNKEVPVYVAKRWDGTGTKRTLHLNILLSIGCIDPYFQEKTIPKPRAKKQQNHTKQNKKDTELEQQNDVVDLDTSDSDSEYEIQDVKVRYKKLT